MRTLLLIYTLSAFSAHAATLVYEKNLGANLVAVDSKGNVFVASSGTLTQLNPDGSVSYSKTPLVPGIWSGIAVDGLGNIVIVGTTSDDNLPTSAGVLQPRRNSSGTCTTTDTAATAFPCQDAFVAKFDPAGNLLWVTYLGGKAAEQANGVALDATGNIFVAGVTSSSDFPIVGGLQTTIGGDADGFVAKISGDGTKILYSTFLGGSGHDIAHAVAVDSAGNAFIAGEGQTGLPSTPKSFGKGCSSSSVQAFLLKLSPTGGLVYGGCVGSSGGSSAATAVTVDAAGNVYLGGVTAAKDFPITSGAFDGRSSAASSDFLAKVSPDGSTLSYSSLLDGAPAGIYSIAVDSSGSVIAAGSTVPSTATVAGPTLQPCTAPGSSSLNFLLKLNPGGTKLSYFSLEDGSQPTISVATPADGSVVEAAGSVRKFTSLDGSGTSYLSPFCVLNGASLISHLQSGQPGISPGELVTLQGVGLGPATAVNFDAASNVVPTSLGGTQVLFDGIPAPILSAQDRQLNVIAPYALSTKTQTSIQIKFQSNTSQAVTVPVSAISAALLMNPQTGRPLVLNQDLSSNSTTNPAALGSTMNLFVTGAGQTIPPSLDGQVSQAPGMLQVNVTAVLQNFSASPILLPISVLYAGPAQGRISAIEQVAVQIPADLPSYFLTGPAAGNNRLLVTFGSQGISVPVTIR